jgi:hypothetical protein
MAAVSQKMAIFPALLRRFRDAIRTCGKFAAKRVAKRRKLGGN